MSLYNRVCKIAKEKGLAISRIERECNLSNATIRRWTTQNPSLDSVQRVAQYLNVSIDYLAGISEQAQLVCDEVPLTDAENDIIAMLRILDDHAFEDVLDFVTMKYEKATGEKVSIYSTYIEDESERRKNGPEQRLEAHDGTA